MKLEAHGAPKLGIEFRGGLAVGGPHGAPGCLTSSVTCCAQVAICGVDLREVDAAWYRRRLGVVSQDPHLFSDSIARNIAYGAEGVSQADIEAAALAANADAFIRKLPCGYQTMVNDKCALQSLRMC